MLSCRPEPPFLSSTLVLQAALSSSQNYVKFLARLRVLCLYLHEILQDNSSSLGLLLPDSDSKIRLSSFLPDQSPCFHTVLLGHRPCSCCCSFSPQIQVIPPVVLLLAELKRRNKPYVALRLVFFFLLYRARPIKRPLFQNPMKHLLQPVFLPYFHHCGQTQTPTTVWPITSNLPLSHPTLTSPQCPRIKYLELLPQVLSNCS